MSAELISKLTSRGVVVHLETNYVSMSMNTDNLCNLIAAIQAVSSPPREVKEKEKNTAIVAPLPSRKVGGKATTIRRRRQRVKAKEKELLSGFDQEDSVSLNKKMEVKDSQVPTFTMAEIQAKRRHIRVTDPVLIAYPDIKDSLITSLLNYYDSIFFAGKISSFLAEKGLTFIGRSSRKLTNCVSTFSIDNKTIIYYVSHPLLMGINPDNVTAILINCSSHVADRMEALMQVIEHDLVHIYEFVTCGNDMDATHSTYFNNTAAKLFGHIRSTHVLLNTTAKSNKQYTHLDFKKGQRVYFINAKDKKIEATVLYLGEKEATILVDSKEHKQISIPYSRLYPLLQLKK